jgi:glucose-6-phosphate isomerase
MTNSFETADFSYSHNQDASGLNDWQSSMKENARARYQVLLNAPTYDGTFLSLRRKDPANYQDTFSQLASFLEYLSKHSIKNIVHLGIGGSILGPQLLYDVCASYLKPAYHCYFFSSFDPQLQSFLNDVDWNETIFLVVSKSFTTDEVLWQWDLVKRAAQVHQKNPHAFAITSQVERAKHNGFSENAILVFPHEAGGRFSMCSVVSASVAAAFGLDVFADCLEGAWAIDKALESSHEAHNPAYQMALNAYHAVIKEHKQSRVILAYHAQLEKLVPYIQQLEMESLGKQLDRDGKKIESWLAPVIWGGVGTGLQHSVFQSILQGGLELPLDFIVVKGNDDYLMKYKDHFNAQLTILKNGYQTERADETIKPNSNFQVIKLEGLSARTLGCLVAIYEHKILWLASLLNMDPFTQPGVQAAKTQLKIAVKTNKA